MKFYEFIQNLQKMLRIISRVKKSTSQPPFYFDLVILDWGSRVPLFLNISLGQNKAGVMNPKIFLTKSQLERYLYKLTKPSFRIYKHHEISFGWSPLLNPFFLQISCVWLLCMWEFSQIIFIMVARGGYLYYKHIKLRDDKKFHFKIAISS